MALDLNKLGTDHNGAITKQADGIVGPLAALLVNADTLIHQVGPEDLKKRVDVALAVLRGKNDEVLAQVLSALDPEAQDLVRQVVTGQLTQRGLDELKAKADQPTPPPDNAPKIPQGILDKAKTVVDTTTEAAKAADEAATALAAVKGRRGVSDEVKSKATLAKDKSDESKKGAEELQKLIDDEAKVVTPTPLPASTS